MRGELEREQEGGADDDEQRADRERDVEVVVELGVDGERQRLGDPRRLPANMIVAPNSPRPRANASAAPAARPPRASGSAMRKNVRAGPAPSVREASTRFGSTASNAAIAWRT